MRRSFSWNWKVSDFHATAAIIRLSPLIYERMETIAISSSFAMEMDAQHARFQKTGSPGRVAGTEGCPRRSGRAFWGLWRPVASGKHELQA